jgi:hypothetical protein
MLAARKVTLVENAASIFPAISPNKLISVFYRPGVDRCLQLFLAAVYCLWRGRKIEIGPLFII